MRPYISKSILVILFVAFWAGVIGANRSLAFQSLMNKAKKFGAKDCLFCHTHEEGGAGWNERGQWLIAEKERRKAEKIDADWLVDYKPEEKR
jgi:hypothetical protein